MAVSSEGLLKMVIMSATVDVNRFSQYWPGRQFPFNIRHVSETTEDWQKTMTMLSTIFNIHKEAAAQQDVLAFLTGLEEMESMARQMRSTAKEFPDRGWRWSPCTLPSLRSISSRCSRG